jgi:hypothetical protein
MASFKVDRRQLLAKSFTTGVALCGLQRLLELVSPSSTSHLIGTEFTSSFSFDLPFENTDIALSKFGAVQNIPFLSSALPGLSTHWFKNASKVRAQFIANGELLGFKKQIEPLSQRVVFSSRWASHGDFIRFCQATEMGALMGLLEAANLNPRLSPDFAVASLFKA